MYPQNPCPRRTGPSAIFRCDSDDGEIPNPEIVMQHETVRCPHYAESLTRSRVECGGGGSLQKRWWPARGLKTVCHTGLGGSNVLRRNSHPHSLSSMMSNYHHSSKNPPPKTVKQHDAVRRPHSAESLTHPRVECRTPNPSPLEQHEVEPPPLWQETPPQNGNAA